MNSLISKNIVIVDAELLKTLANSEALPLLLTPKMRVYISDMVIKDLEIAGHCNGSQLALAFINEHLGNGIEIAVTGVPAIASQLAELGVDPGDESIRRLVNHYEDETEGEYALVVSEDGRFISNANSHGRTFMMTTRQFFSKLEAIMNEAGSKPYLTLADRKNIKMDAMPIGIAAIRSELLDYARSHGGRFILYGSIARGDYRPGSDVDILVDFPADKEPDAWRFAEDVCAKHSFEPDVRSIGFCRQEFVKKILAYAEVIQA